LEERNIIKDQGHFSKKLDHGKESAYKKKNNQAKAFKRRAVNTKQQRSLGRKDTGNQIPRRRKLDYCKITDTLSEEDSSNARSPY